MIEEKKYCVYIHIFPNEKTYIGITCQNPKYRWRHDGTGYKPKKKNSSRMWNAILKYGWDNIKHEILYKNLTKEDACQKEIELIALYQSNNKKFGYNISKGGESSTLEEETKQKISNARKGNNYGMIGENAPMYGKHHTEEAKQKISNALSGENNPSYGKPCSEEKRQKAIVAHLDDSKPVEQYDKQGNLIGVYRSIHEASRRTGINRSCIRAALNGDQKTAGKCIWKYANISSLLIFNQQELCYAS